MSINKAKYEVNIFYHFANEYVKRAVEDAEIEKIDFTAEFWLGWYGMFEHGEIAKLNINGSPGTGKSLVGATICYQSTKKVFKREFGIKDIDRDQLEYSLTMRNGTVKDTIRLVDEMNELGETGENSTVEQALFGYFSDVMAQRHVHAVFCSPTQTTDRNVLLYLEVISTDKVNKKTHCKLYYKINRAGMEIRQLLGMVTIDVSEVLEKDWYKEYRRRKFEKMDLILNEGIFQPMKLIYAGLALNVINKLKVLTREIRLPTQPMIRNFVKAEWSKAKMAQSLVGEINATKDVEGILDGYKEYHRITKQLQSIDGEVAKGKITPETATVRKHALIKSREILMESIELQEKELERCAEINDKYNMGNKDSKKVLKIEVSK